jgi:glycosyltransferase involved in cell wall biosynthesis
MKITLIIATYNWKEALSLCFESILRQTIFPCEVIVADDGSTANTRELVGKFAKQAPFPVFHCWQEDRGFRLARIRNMAIARASCDYLVLIDGDMILEKRFIEDHLRFAKTGFFSQGGRVLLSEKLTERVIEKGRLPDFLFFRKDVGNRKNFVHFNLLADLFIKVSRGLVGIKGCNFAFWREDCLRVNGFNEEFIGWGREDSEFAMRMLNGGIMRRNIRFSGIACHLYHPVNERKNLPVNDQILQKTIKDGLKWCEHGLSRHTKNTLTAGTAGEA